MNNWEKLARTLIHNSCDLQKGEKLLIEYSCCPQEFVLAIVKEAEKVGGLVYLWHIEDKIRHELVANGCIQQWSWQAHIDQNIMQQVDAVIMIRGENNSFLNADVDAKKQEIFAKQYSEPVHTKTRLQKKWVLLRYPTDSFAQSSKMNTQVFEEYFYHVCCLDYRDLCNRMEPLKTLMEKTNTVRIVGKGTDLTFSIQGIPAVKCCGERNIPDGEIYTAPIKDSIEGTITFNVPVMYQGKEFDQIKLQFHQGKVVHESCNQQQELTNILNTDAGSRYVGEFAFGVNPYVTFAVRDILFDEKMYGSIHMALGNSYSDADNGNRSAIHWDLILNQVEGGEIYFDDVLIRKNGEFILPELVVLNRENMIQ